MEWFKSLVKGGLDTFYWLIGNAIFSLFPLLIIYYIKVLGANNSGINDELYNLLKGGIIIFFSCSLMGSIAIDLIIAGSLDGLARRRKLLFKLVLVQMPFVILIGLVVIYLLVLLKQIDKDYLMLGSPFIVFSIIYSGLYAVVYKFYNFGKEENLWS